MVSLRQLYYGRVLRLRKKHTKRNGCLQGCPQKKGFCFKVGTEKPKKPNSAKRRVARVVLFSTKKKIRAQVPGEGAWGVQKFCRLLVRGGHTRDLPGIRYRVLRGKLDAKPLIHRKNARSKFGVKKGLERYM